jgi:hypothetical protein
MTLRSPAGRDSRADEARQKIRKVGELIRLSQNVKTQRTADRSGSYPQPGLGTPQSLKGAKAIGIFMSERKRKRKR